MTANILIVEDDTALRDAICATVELAGYRAHAAADGQEALDQMAARPTDLVISDIQMQPMNGQQLLREVRRRALDTPVVLMTAYGSIEDAVRAMRDGAIDYLVKPFEAEVLAGSIQGWIGTPPDGDADLVAADPLTLRTVELARKVARSESSVMITGESGVGKEVFFRLIHRHSTRAAARPVAINCAAIPENMLEAMLFGYEKGAFTGAYKSCAGKFELANGSSLLLDEISEMGLPLQAKLLRVLQERQVERLGSHEPVDLDVRVVATSNRDLREEVAAGRFREDLYYRLNVFPLEVPALRQRPGDILPLANELLRRTTPPDSVVPVLSPDAARRLRDHAWPGNVRELDNVIQRALIVSNGGRIEADDLMIESVGAPSATPPAVAEAPAPETLNQDLRQREWDIILAALQEAGGSRKQVADQLGLSGRTLRYKLARMREAGLPIPGDRGL